MAKKPGRLTAEEVEALLGDATEVKPKVQEVRPVEFGDLGEGLEVAKVSDDAAAAAPFLWDVPMSLEVELGGTNLTVREVASLAPGSVIELDHSYGDPVDVYLNGRLVGHGEIVIAGENFGIKITALLAGPTQEEAAELLGSDGEINGEAEN